MPVLFFPFLKFKFLIFLYYWYTVLYHMTILSRVYTGYGLRLLSIINY